MVVILALDILQVSKGLIRMNDVWDKIGTFFGCILCMAADNCVYAETDLVHFVPDSGMR